jgi:hypothetical protein
MLLTQQMRQQRMTIMDDGNADFAGKAPRIFDICARCIRSRTAPNQNLPALTGTQPKVFSLARDLNEGV